MYVCARTHTLTTAMFIEVRGQPVGVCPSFYHVGPNELIQGAKLGGKCLESLSQFCELLCAHL